MTCRLAKEQRIACSMPEASLPAIGGPGQACHSVFQHLLGCLDRRLAWWNPRPSTRCPARPGVARPAKVASMAETGTASSTMSEPATASSADSAATSMTPMRLARSVVEGDLE